MTEMKIQGPNGPRENSRGVSSGWEQLKDEPRRGDTNLADTNVSPLQGSFLLWPFPGAYPPGYSLPRLRRWVRSTAKRHSANEPN